MSEPAHLRRLAASTWSGIPAALCAAVSHRVSDSAACPRRLYYTRYYTEAAISTSQPPGTHLSGLWPMSMRSAAQIADLARLRVSWPASIFTRRKASSAGMTVGELPRFALDFQNRGFASAFGGIIPHARLSFEAGAGGKQDVSWLS